MDDQVTIASMLGMLDQLLMENGNLLVVVDDADTGFAFKLKPSHFSISNGVLRIGIEYGDEYADQ